MNFAQMELKKMETIVMIALVHAKLAIKVQTAYHAKEVKFLSMDNVLMIVQMDNIKPTEIILLVKIVMNHVQLVEEDQTLIVNHVLQEKF